MLDYGSAGYGSAGYQVNLPDWAEFYNCDSKHLCQQKVNNHEFVASSSQFRLFFR